MKKRFMVLAAVMTLFAAIDVQADCHTCKPFEMPAGQSWGTICHSGCGMWGACITEWDGMGRPKCVPLSDCPQSTVCVEERTQSVDDPWSAPAAGGPVESHCSAWVGCVAEQLEAK